MYSSEDLSLLRRRIMKGVLLVLVQAQVLCVARVAAWSCARVGREQLLQE